MITCYKYDNMTVENNRTIFKNFEEFELYGYNHIFPIQITEIEFNLVEPEYECVLYINNHVEVSRFLIDDIYVTKNIYIKNDLKELILIETITIEFHYENKLFKFIIKTNITEEKLRPLSKEEVYLNEVIDPLSILRDCKPTTFIDPMTNFDRPSTDIDLSLDEEIIYADEDDLFIDEGEEVKTQSKTVIGNDDVMKDIGSDINFDEDFDDLI